MFKPYDAFLHLNHKIFTIRELEDEMAKIHVRYRTDLPAEVGVRELLDLGHTNHWFIEEKGGKLRVEVIYEYQ